ncbi:MAG TPA: 3'-5' exonuclease [Accumulibacter sp.]|uniref:3'-5' exonuclease n=1 Tax=Accumulibacter sp. TaxID=2053492 RepID=UPI002C1C5E28|nr:3'-5' exonuclease [Accumulibacter sp.]HRF72296.1 3'-5' exonuclease [Accumulibacter sp.]
MTTHQRQLLAAWRQLPAAAMNRSHYRSRYVVVDVEVAGADWQTDPLGAIAALAVADGQIDFQQALRVDVANGHAASEATAPPPGSPALLSIGEQRAEALLAFLGFVGKAPLVAYHASFAARRIERAMAESLGVELRLPWIDLAWVMASLFREIGDAQAPMDRWLAHFDVESIERHNAVSDAYVTAQLLQVTIARAARDGFETPTSLLELEKAHRHLYQSA